MTFDDYQSAARATAVYQPVNRLLYPTLGLCGEAGEVAEAVKKHVRDNRPDDQTRELLRKELGDVLWYLAAVCTDAGLTLGEVAAGSLAKLADRRNRGVLHGSGDDR